MLFQKQWDAILEYTFNASFIKMFSFATIILENLYDKRLFEDIVYKELESKLRVIYDK